MFSEEVEESQSEGGLLSGLLSFILMIVIVIACYFGLREFVVGTYEIPSGSMEETIQVGDRVFSEKVTYYFNDVQAGDIITFKDPEDSSRTLIKRVIATAGQTVDLIDGYVYVDGEKLDEDYTDGEPSWPLDTAYGVVIEYPYTVPEGCLWVMGDNRTNSADSRYFGAIDADSVTGHACFTFWPLDRIGVLD